MKYLPTAFAQLRFAWKLYNYALEGGVDLERLDVPIQWGPKSTRTRQSRTRRCTPHSNRTRSIHVPNYPESAWALALWWDTARRSKCLAPRIRRGRKKPCRVQAVIRPNYAGDILRAASDD